MTPGRRLLRSGAGASAGHPGNDDEQNDGQAKSTARLHKRIVADRSRQVSSAHPAPGVECALDVETPRPPRPADCIGRTERRLSAGLFVGRDTRLLLKLLFPLLYLLSQRLHIDFCFLRLRKNLLFFLGHVVIHVLPQNSEFRVVQILVGRHLLQLADKLFGDWHARLPPRR